MLAVLDRGGGGLGVSLTGSVISCRFLAALFSVAFALFASEMGH